MNPRSNSPTQIPKFAAGLQNVPSERRKSDSIWKFTSATFRTCLILVGILFLESCGLLHHRVPSIDVFGSYFPAWLISLAVGVVLTVIAGGAGRLMDIRPPGMLAPLLCVSLILIFSTSVWFFFFAS